MESEGAIRRLMAAYLDAADHRRDGVEIAANREHLTFSLHLPGSESIVVDGDRATGTWTYLQAAVHDGQAVWVAGRWRNDFTRVNKVQASLPAIVPAGVGVAIPRALTATRSPSAVRNVACTFSCSTPSARTVR